MLRVTLFGAGLATYCGHPVAGFPTQQHCRLLCYLILNRGAPQSRERLAALFWSDYSTATSRTYLRNALWRLRQALQTVGSCPEQYLSADDENVTFLTTGSCSLDIDDFEAAVMRHRDQEPDGLSADQAAHLEEAVDLYVGDLLDGIYDDWCLYDRERFRLMYMNALARLLAFHEKNGSYEKGLEYGKRILTHDPTRERVHRQLMRLYWLSGNQREAIAQYKLCKQILREELGIPPMARTRLLHQQMVANQFDASAWSQTGRAGSAHGDCPDDSLQTLAERALERLQHIQAMTEETGTELSHIQRLLRKALTDGSRA